MAWFILMLLFSFFVFPTLVVPLMMLLSLLLLFYLPIKFTFSSLQTIVTAPKQLYLIATNKALRRNHALEHATINVLQENYGQRLAIAGYAETDGFFVRSNLPAWEIEAAARKALSRLKDGEKNLVIHKQCGTSLLAANLLSSLLFIALLLVTRMFNIWLMLFALLVANLIGPYFGEFLQRHLTTLASVDNMVIRGIEYRYPHDGSFDLWVFVTTDNLLSF